MTKRPVAFRALLAGLVAILIVACKRETVTTCLSPADSAECFVTDFYSWYATPKAKGGPGANAREAMRIRRAAFSPALLSALGSDTNDVRLDFDPFLRAQGPCDRYVTGKVEKGGQRTRIAIHCVAKYRNPKPSVIAEVSQVDSTFTFTNFLYADSLQPPYSDVFTLLAELPIDRTVYYARGGCPFECCRYGEWVMRTAATLRSNYRGSPDSVGILAAGDKVRADSGVVVLQPMGLAIVTDTTLKFETAGAKPAVRVGDTLLLLDYHGEGYRSVRWHDMVFTMEEQWDSTGSRGARLVRKPVSAWWVHMTRGNLRGWVNMTGVEVGGSDACGR